LRFRSRRQLEVENLFLRHQLNIALRHAPRAEGYREQTVAEAKGQASRFSQVAE